MATSIASSVSSCPAGTRPARPRPPVGAEVVAGAKVVGALTSVTEAPHELRALGYLRREVDIPAEVRLRWPGGERAAVAEALPGR